MWWSNNKGVSEKLSKNNNQTVGCDDLGVNIIKSGMNPDKVPLAEKTFQDIVIESLNAINKSLESVTKLNEEVQSIKELQIHMLSIFTKTLNHSAAINEELISTDDISQGSGDTVEVVKYCEIEARTAKLIIRTVDTETNFILMKKNGGFFIETKKRLFIPDSIIKRECENLFDVRGGNTGYSKIIEPAKVTQIRENSFSLLSKGIIQVEN